MYVGTSTAADRWFGFEGCEQGFQMVSNALIGSLTFDQRLVQHKMWVGEISDLVRPTGEELGELQDGAASERAGNIAPYTVAQKGKVTFH